MLDFKHIQKQCLMLIYNNPISCSQVLTAVSQAPHHSSVRIWDASTGALLHLIHSHNMEVSVLSVC